MFSQNRKRPISVDLRGCFHDTSVCQYHDFKGLALGKLIGGLGVKIYFN